MPEPTVALKLSQMGTVMVGMVQFLCCKCSSANRATGRAEAATEVKQIHCAYEITVQVVSHSTGNGYRFHGLVGTCAGRIGAVLVGLTDG